MMKLKTLFLVLIVYWLKPLHSQVSYDSFKTSMNAKRLQLKKRFDSGKISLDSVGILYTDQLVNGLFSYWYGTAWDFEGYTAVPRQGVVACGYFVSTTLKHSGFVLNRYRMAQKSASEGARYLEPQDSLKKYRCSRDSFVAKFMREAKDGLYTVGLSFHVGFIYKQGAEIYFIHSNYINSQGVVKEKASESQALSQSSVFLIADITHNKKLMKKWLNGSELLIQ